MNPSDESILAGKRVIICEDEGITQLQLGRIMKRAGLEVVESAVTGEQAIAAAGRNNADIILMDIDLPGMDGLDAARRILESGPVCMVFLSGYSDSDHVTRAQQAEASGYIVKPITGDTVIRQVEEAYTAYCEKRISRS